MKNYICIADHDTVPLERWSRASCERVDSPMSWIEEHIKGRWAMSKSLVNDDLYFENDSDYVLFVLTWI